MIITMIENGQPVLVASRQKIGQPVPVASRQKSLIDLNPPLRRFSRRFLSSSPVFLL